MQSTCSALRLGGLVRFRDRWQGRLASFEVDDDWLVLNLVISRGIFRPSEVKLPFSIATDWDDDSLSLDCTSYEAFRREIPPLAVPPKPLSAKTPLSLAGFRLAGALVERISRRAGHLMLSRGLFASDQRVVPVQDIAFEGGSIRLATQADALPIYRRDSELLQAVRDSLAAHPYLTADDRHSLSVEVVDGTAYLSGNVRTPQAEAHVHEAASSVLGAAAVRSDVMNDRQLEIDIGQALNAAGLFRHARVYVRAALGEVTLGGFLNSAAPIPDILRVAEAVPGVRSLDNRMEVVEPPPQSAPAASPQPPAEDPATSQDRA
ncbi:MAG: BON domain-containing protein [Chloroflexi bacterium]|nr:BON domain-containing protein [Chloroflexota bacterium]